VPHIIVTHRPPSRPTEGPIDFRFVEGIEAAVAAAMEAAAGKVVALGGGGDVARQCLAGGLVDEIQLHVVPVVLAGPRLFGAELPGLRPTEQRVVDAPNVTHLRYRVGGVSGS
jgi:dihydrofolate reductase